MDPTTKFLSTASEDKGSTGGTNPFIEAVLDDLEAAARGEMTSCWECGRLMEVVDGWPPICETCWTDVRAGRWPRRDRASEGEKWRKGWAA